MHNLRIKRPIHDVQIDVMITLSPAVNRSYLDHPIFKAACGIDNFQPNTFISPKKIIDFCVPTFSP